MDALLGGLRKLKETDWKSNASDHCPVKSIFGWNAFPLFSDAFSVLLLLIQSSAEKAPREKGKETPNSDSDEWKARLCIAEIINSTENQEN